MSAISEKYFDGVCTIADAHDALRATAGNATWLNEFLSIVKGPKKRITEVLLWLFYNLGLCCTIVVQFYVYIGGKLASHPNLIIIYTANHPQKLCPEISALLENCPNPFSFD